MESAASPSLSHTHTKPRAADELPMAVEPPILYKHRLEPHLSTASAQLSPDPSATLLLSLLLAFPAYTLNSPLWTPKPKVNFISMKWKENIMGSIKRLGVTKLKIIFFFSLITVLVECISVPSEYSAEYEKSPQNYTIEVQKEE